MKTKLIFWVAYAAAIIYLVNLTPELPKKQEIGVKSSTLDLIHRYEGFSKSAYQDSTGRWTIGVGHQIKDSEPQLLLANLSKKEVGKLLERDLRPCETFLKDSLGKPLTQNQFDALVIFTFNVGVSAFQNSTLARLVNASDFAKASDEFPKWCKIHTKQGMFVELRGLKNRRLAEQELFNKEDV